MSGRTFTITGYRIWAFAGGGKVPSHQQIAFDGTCDAGITSFRVDFEPGVTSASAMTKDGTTGRVVLPLDQFDLFFRMLQSEKGLALHWNPGVPGLGVSVTRAVPIR